MKKYLKLFPVNFFDLLPYFVIRVDFEIDLVLLLILKAMEKMPRVDVYSFKVRELT